MYSETVVPVQAPLMPRETFAKRRWGGSKRGGLAEALSGNRSNLPVWQFLLFCEIFQSPVWIPRKTFTKWSLKFKAGEGNQGWWEARTTWHKNVFLDPCIQWMLGLRPMVWHQVWLGGIAQVQPLDKMWIFPTFGVGGYSALIWIKWLSASRAGMLV